MTETEAHYEINLKDKEALDKALKSLRESYRETLVKITAFEKEDYTKEEDNK